MTKRVLSIIETAYRACQEEQDDAGLWFSAAVQAAGVELSILLKGNAVGYAHGGHATQPLTLGGGTVPHPFDPTADIERMAGRGVAFYLVREDAEERGLDAETRLPSVEPIARERLPELFESHGAIWHW